MIERKDESPLCPICKKRCCQLVPFADMDNEHKGKMTCRPCKRKLKAETGELDSPETIKVDEKQDIEVGDNE